MTKKILFYEEKFPISINLIETEEIYTNWHKELKILYFLKGNALVDLNKQKIKCQENDFVLVNSYELSNIQPKPLEKAMILEFLIDSSSINRLYPNFSFMQFNCNSRNENIVYEKFENLRYILSKFVKFSLENEVEKRLLLLKNLLDFSIFLVNNFKVEEHIGEKDISNKHRLIKILNYLEDNYEREDLNIDEISEFISLSPQYLQKFFRKNFSIGIIDYLNSLRIKKSVSDLLYTNKTILEIAIDNGFNNNKSYHRLFKKEYNKSPGSFRKDNLFLQEEENKNFYEEKDLIINFSNYYEREKFNISESARNESILIDIELNDIHKKRFSQNWKKIISLGKAAEGLKGDIQFQLKEVKRDLNPQYVRFTGVFNDEMNLYNEDSEGKAYYNFAYIDKLIDFLVHENLKPYINLGFMPKKLASKEEYVFVSNINVSYPKSINKWKDMVKNFISHLINKYGEEEISTWYFEIWNNPNINGIYWYESNELFYEFYRITFNTIKAVSSNIKVGGPGCNLASENFIEDFLFATKDLKVDFFSFNNYSVKMNFLENQKNNLEDIEFEELRLVNANMKKTVSNIKKNYPNKPEIIMNEWNLNPIPRDFLNDTCYASSYIIKNTLENFDIVDNMVYWTFTENKVGTDVFYGGLGLFTTNNLKKASYNAFLLLNKLGAEILSRGNNHFVTKKQDSFQILLYDYEDLKAPYKLKEIQTNIRDFPQGNYLITKYYLNENSGSIYDYWKQMGAPQKITEDIYQLLKSREKMNIKVEEREVRDNFIIKEVLTPNGIVFYDLKKIN